MKRRLKFALPISGHDSMSGETIPTKRPGETDEEFCIRVFGKASGCCPECGAITDHPGICDRCDEKMKKQAAEATRPCTPDEALIAAGVPSTYLSFTWQGVNLPPDVRPSKIRAWEGTPCVMVLCGPVGTGKSAATACVAKDWILNGRRVRWVFAADWLDALRHSEHEGDPTVEMREIVAFDGLVIVDDVQLRRTTDYAIDRLLQLIDGRTREGRPILVTSNLPPVSTSGPSLRDIDERLGSRLAGGLVIRWPGADRRISNC